MHIYIVFAHPSTNSFTHKVLQSFCAGLAEVHHTYEIGDLYALNFKSDMDEEQYKREIDWNHPQAPVPEDVLREQEKVNRADGLVFIYPVWWSDCPAKLKGWFDRVWSYGFAYVYGESKERSSRVKARRALVICPAGHTIEHLDETGIAQSMRCVMLHDRLQNVGIQEARMEILGGMTEGGPEQARKNLARAYELGKTFFK